MNQQKSVLFGIVLLLVGGTAGVLQRVHASHRLGNPGLKMIVQPVFDTEGNVIGTNTIDLPVRVLDYTSKPLGVTLEELSWLPKDTTYGRREYKARDGFTTQVSIVLMGTDRTSIHKPQICLEGQGWRIRDQEVSSVRIQNPAPYGLPVMKLTSTKQIQTRDGKTESWSAIFVYWFVAENRLTARHGERMWWMAVDLLSTGVLPRWAYVSCQAFCRPGQEELTFSRMKEFIAASVPDFQTVHGQPSVP